MSHPRQQDAEMEQDDGQFMQISRFCTKSNQHILKMGIMLSKNHPVLQDSKTLKELREKTKATKIEVVANKVSCHYFLTHL